MGVSRSYNAWLGVRLPWNLIEVEEVYDYASCGCGPEFTTETFCSKCGIKVAIKQGTDRYLQSYVIEDENSQRMIGDYDISFDNTNYMDPKWAFLGDFIRVEEAETAGLSADSTYVEEVRSKLKATLEPLGIWKDEYFAFWICLSIM